MEKLNARRVGIVAYAFVRGVVLVAGYNPLRRGETWRQPGEADSGE